MESLRVSHNSLARSILSLLTPRRLKDLNCFERFLLYKHAQASNQIESIFISPSDDAGDGRKSDWCRLTELPPRELVSTVDSEKNAKSRLRNKNKRYTILRHISVHFKQLVYIFMHSVDNNNK